MHSSRRTVLVCALSLASTLGCVDGNTSNSETSSGAGTSLGSASSGGSNTQVGQGGSGNDAGTGVAQGAGTSTGGSAGNPAGGSTGNPAGGNAGVSAAGSGGTPPVITFPTAARGATLTYLEYEAEDSATNGMVLGPSRKTAASNDVAAESSNRKAVQLNA